MTNIILDQYEQDLEDSFNDQQSIKTRSLLDHFKIVATKHLKNQKV
jgi:predicted DNA binding CopG/RHH family protein